METLSPVTRPIRARPPAPIVRIRRPTITGTDSRKVRAYVVAVIVRDELARAHTDATATVKVLEAGLTGGQFGWARRLLQEWR